MFIVLLKYIKPLEEVNPLREAHLSHLDSYYQSGMLVCSGRMNPPEGGVLLSNAPSRADVDRMIEGDPYNKNGAATYTVVEFSPARYDPRFAPFVETAG